MISTHLAQVCLGIGPTDTQRTVPVKDRLALREPADVTEDDALDDAPCERSGQLYVSLSITYTP
jgi:hypothetical protein